MPQWIGLALWYQWVCHQKFRGGRGWLTASRVLRSVSSTIRVWHNVMIYLVSKPKPHFYPMRRELGSERRRSVVRRFRTASTKTAPDATTSDMMPRSWSVEYGTDAVCGYHPYPISLSDWLRTEHWSEETDVFTCLLTSIAIGNTDPCPKRQVKVRLRLAPSLDIFHVPFGCPFSRGRIVDKTMDGTLAWGTARVLNGLVRTCLWEAINCRDCADLL